MDVLAMILPIILESSIPELTDVQRMQPTVPVEFGVNAPSEGTAFEWINGRNWELSTANYPVPCDLNPAYGYVCNPHLIRIYLEKADSDCRNNVGRPITCDIRQPLWNFLKRAAYDAGEFDVYFAGPQGTIGVDGNRVAGTSMVDAMYNTGMAVSLNKRSDYDKAYRALKALDVPESDGGIYTMYQGERYYLAGGSHETTQRMALNVATFAILDAHNLCQNATGALQTLACSVRDKGIAMLNNTDFINRTDRSDGWSYHRIIRSWHVASCDYHRLNGDNLRRLADLGFDYSGKLRQFADRWLGTWQANCG